ncbi:MAG TPA: SgcJ/EcaC family oxidoreductase [Nitrososphaerales archaeon]|nr:SgcJ/EcaC family oxidoreductase [Nitrososphaerales archaeon]
MARLSHSKANAKIIQAYQPSDCDRLLMEAMEEGDIETAVALYEPHAVLLTESGDLMKGRDEIRKHNEEFISLKATTTIDEIRTTISGDGSIATTRMKCTSVFLDPRSGNQVRLLTNTFEVVRKQSDGTWRFVIDDPFGGTRANK